MVVDNCDFCIECGKVVYPGIGGQIPWFCGEWCASACSMFSMKVGFDPSPEAAIMRLSERHMLYNDDKDLKRIEKILDKLIVA